MNIFKLIIGMVLMISMMGIAFAADTFFETNQTISLDATYTQGGILSEADANYSVESPTGEVLLNQIGMIELSTGVFKSNYTTPLVTGKYLITVVYYNKTTSTEIGRDSRYIQVGYAGAFTLGEAPQSTTQLTTMWIILGIALLLAIIGITMNITILTMFSGILFLIMSAVTLPFSTILGAITILVGVIFLLTGMFTKT
jgi:hypothetical protein